MRIVCSRTSLTTPDGCLHVIGTGTPAFTVRLTSDAGVAALASFNELAIAEAFMNGHLDIEGEMTKRGVSPAAAH